MRRCKMCGRWDWIEKHHVFGGANRKNSEKYHMTVDLCLWCHNEPPHGVHFNRENDLKLKQEYQKTFEQEHTREEFRKIFGRSYL